LLDVKDGLEEAEALCNRIAMLKRGQVVALDSTRNLFSSIAGCKVRLKLSATMPETLLSQVVGQEGEDYILGLCSYPALESVLVQLREAEVSVLEMSMQQPDLTVASRVIISIQERIRGMQIMLSSQESVSTQGIGLAAQLVASGKYQAALTGGIDIYSRALHACYSTTRKVSPLDGDEFRSEDPTIRPWGGKRNGFIFSEGACYLLLEDIDLAKARGTRIYGLIAGWGTSQEPSYDGYEIDEGGTCLSDSIDQALTRAGIKPVQVNTVIASANGSTKKDAIELQVLSNKFSQSPVSVTSFKHLLGETLGASGAFSAALACLHFERFGYLPAFNNGTSIHGGLKYSSEKEQAGDTLLITDLGYHGDSATLLLRKY